MANELALCKKWR